MKPLFPHITVQLSGEDGNAFAIIGRVLAAMREDDVPKATREEFVTEATSGDYDDVLRTCMKYVDVA